MVGGWGVGDPFPGQVRKVPSSSLRHSTQAIISLARCPLSAAWLACVDSVQGVNSESERQKEPVSWGLQKTKNKTKNLTGSKEVTKEEKLLKARLPIVLRWAHLSRGTGLLVSGLLFRGVQEIGISSGSPLNLSPQVSGRPASCSRGFSLIFFTFLEPMGPCRAPEGRTRFSLPSRNTGTSVCPGQPQAMLGLWWDKDTVDLIQ